MDEQQQKHSEAVTAVFDTVCSGYDSPALRHFPLVADYMAKKLAPQPGWRILDACCGTGALSIAVGQRLPDGRVHGIDLSEGMLARAGVNIERVGLDNIDLHVMSAQEPDFEAGTFDAVMSSFGLFFLPDMLTGLKQWLRMLKPGGSVMFSCFTESAFQPMSNLLMERLVSEGIELPENPAWKKIADPVYGRELLEQAGATDIELETRQFGFHLDSADDWWTVVWNSGFRKFVDQLEPSALDRVRQAHLDEVQALAGNEGVWMDVMVHLFLARRPE